MDTDSSNISFNGWKGGFLLCVALCFMLVRPVTASVITPPPSFQRQVQPLVNVEQLVLPATDVQAELAADEKQGNPAPLRFAHGLQVNVTPATYGTWEELADGRLWRLRIGSAGATDLNLGFTTFWLPEGATLHITAEAGGYFQGPYTARNNKPHEQLWTPVLPGEAVVIELFVPARVTQQPRLVLGQVGGGYRNFFPTRNPTPTPLNEGACNIDVVCPVAAGWTNEIRSVGLYTIAGAFTCTGTLIADVAGDFRNYFLTANHCGLNSVNASSVVVYWNYQSTNCGTHGPGSLGQNQSGAVFRAARADVDFALLELEETPAFDFGAYYSGWDRSGMPPVGGVGIHHPDFDVKAISFSSNLLTTVNSCIGSGTNTHWQVIWYLGVTETGSSGSGIWDPATHFLVGQLSGGGSSCATPNSPDCYGKFALAWGSGDSAANRLRDWLDPQQTGVTNVAGVDPALATIIEAAGSSLIAEGCSPANGAIDPGETVTVNFALKNIGGVPATNLMATLMPAAGVVLPSAAQNYGTLAGGDSPVSLPFTFTAEGACGGTIAPTFQIQDGARNLGMVTFSFKLGVATNTMILAENFDGVVAPALPIGWTTSTTGAGMGWLTSTSQVDTPPNAAFDADSAFVSDSSLISPLVKIGSALSQLTFRHFYDTESGYDGGVLEISINGATFTDILSAGGDFVTHGYNQTIPTCCGNPLGGRLAWSGNSGGFVTTAANLPPAASGQSIQLRWRLGSDSSMGIVGWYVDTVTLTQPGYACCTGPAPPLIVNPRITGPGNIAFSYDSTAGQIYFVEVTTNLGAAHWIVVQTNAGDGSLQSFTNSAAGLQQSFFRLRMQQ
jgi:hypothetical protein